MVSVMESFEGSSPGRLLIEASSVCKLYRLRQLGLLSGLDSVEHTPEGQDHCCALLRNSLQTSMLRWRHRYTILKSSACTVLDDRDVHALEPQSKVCVWAKMRSLEIDAEYPRLTALR